MKVRFDILRRESGSSQPYIQSIDYETDDCNAVVSGALTDINSTEGYTDTSGNMVSYIRWECSCLQKKCGACAMLINSYPRLACDARLSECSVNGVIRLEPLRKFPVVADLIVDRSVMRENLKSMNTWFEREHKSTDAAGGTAYEASRCLQCGCCLEICPNFYVGSEFFGSAALVPASRIIALSDKEDSSAASTLYKKHYYNGCGKSLSCRDVCPANIAIDDLLVRSNAAAVWRRKFGKKK